MDWVERLVTILCAIIASSGFWAWLQRRRDRNDSVSKLVMGLAHDRIITLGIEYIERGWVTKDEFENLHDYLYLPYKANEGNGSGDRVMLEVEKLPIKAMHVDTGSTKTE